MGDGLRRRSMDFTDELERSIPAGPATCHPLPAPHERLRVGRQVRRRRRLASGGAALAVTALVAGAFTVLDLPAEQTPAATTRPRTSATASADPQPFLWRTQEPITQFTFDDQAFYDTDGELVVRDGADVLRRVDNPQGVAAPAQTVGLVTRWQGAEYWTFAWGDGESASTDTVAVDDLPAPATLEEWLADQAARYEVSYYDAQLVSLTADGTLTPARDSVTVLAQTKDVPAGMRHQDVPAATGVVAIGDARLCVGAAGDQISYQSAREYGPDLAACTALFEHWAPDVD
jgi:hypothetical protein